MSQAAIIGVVVLMVVCSSSSAAMLMMGGEEKPSEASPVASPAAKWRVEERIDYPGNDIFHYHPKSKPVANERVCLDKCMSMNNCKLVTFNKAKTLCWGKKAAANRKNHGDRFNYFKR